MASGRSSLRTPRYVRTTVHFREDLAGLSLAETLAGRAGEAIPLLRERSKPGPQVVRRTRSGAPGGLRPLLRRRPPRGRPAPSPARGPVTSPRRSPPPATASLA